MKRFSLPWRLLGLLAIVIVPALAALIFVQLQLRGERMQRGADAAMHQAELVAADTHTLIDGARQLSIAIAHSHAMTPFAPSCAGPLDVLRQSLGGYALVAVLTQDGSVVCSARAPSAPTAAAVWAATLHPQIGDSFRLGTFLQLGSQTPLLPMFQPFTLSTGERGFVVCAIDLDWLQAHFQRLHLGADNTLVIADRDGTVLVRIPEGSWRGMPIVAGAQAHLADRAAGVVDIVGLDGMPRRVGFVPPAITGGLYVGYGLYLPSIVAEVDQAARRGYVLLGIGALLALALMQVGIARLVHQPTEALLDAAQRWTRGDLGARARIGVTGHNEFGRLAFAFNLMAETLQARQRQLQELNASLESAVEDRTTELSETNNRLLVEIAERERTDAALRQAQKLSAVGQLAGGVAHEFNNLLTTVMGGLELLRVRLGAEHKLVPLIDRAQSAALRGGKLTGQLLAFAHRRRLLPVPVDLNAVVTDMTDLLAGTMGRAITVATALTPDLPSALADRHEIEAAILNLALNAKEAMPQGGTLTLATRTCTAPLGCPNAPSDHGIELSVSDDGRGMAEEELTHAIDPFFTTKPQGEGAGLGLSQAHGLIQQLGGSLRLESTPGSGTTVHLWLPHAPTPAALEPAILPPAAACGRYLLLVDDDAPVRQIAADMLAEAGYHVTQAQDGPSALDVLRARAVPFDAIVADYSMPGMTGVQLIAEAHTLVPNLPAVVITGFIELNPADTAKLDPRQVVRKPFTIRELQERIEERLRV